MEGNLTRLIMLIAIGWAITFVLRGLPFMLFAGRNRELPRWVIRFGAISSPIIIAGLTVYFFTALEWRTPWPYLASVLTIGLQFAFRNGLVSVIAGTALYMFLLSAGCTTARTVVELDAENPELRIASDGVYVGERRVQPEEVITALEEASVPKSRAIRICVDGDIRNPRAAWPLQQLLRAGGYTRSILVTERKSVSAEIAVRLETDGFHVGDRIVTADAVPAAIASAGVPKERTVRILVGDGVRDASPAYNLRIRLKQLGYKLVDVAEANYDNQFMFLVTEKGVRYGRLTWINPEEIPVALKRDHARSDSLVRICSPASGRTSERVRAIMDGLEDVLRQAGYTNVQRFWLESAL